jgi:23S rRNA pseudouridine1911/1915/1917 synthase
VEEIDIKDNLFEHFSFSVDPGQDPLRIDKFLMNRVEMLQEIRFKLLRKTIAYWLMEIQ